MKHTSFAAMDCSIARCLDIVGERWSLLILRDAFLGTTRFDRFQERLGIARNVLQQRLGRLVDEGVLIRQAYQEHPMRYDYLLTDKGRDLFPVITSMRQWGDHYAAPDGPPIELRHHTCGHIAQAVEVCSVCGERFEYGNVSAVRNRRVPAG